jgi:hypothetical protein
MCANAMMVVWHDRSCSDSGIAWIYFVVLIVVSSFIILNIFVAVIAERFLEFRNEQREKEETRETNQYVDDDLMMRLWKH